MPPLPFSRNPDEGQGNALDRAPLIALLEPQLRQRVRKALSRRRIQAGKPLVRQGDAADALYLIESGRFRVFVSERAGHERVLQFLGPCETIGEAAFMAETPHVTTAMAVEDASVWRLSRADFDALLGKHDAALRYLAGVIAQRQALANARLAAESAPEDRRVQRGFVTAVFSPRGGAGVTTVAVNVSVALAERRPDDVALLDLDVLFGHVLANLWLEPRGILAHASPITLRHLDRGGLDRYLLPHPSSLRVFPSATRPEEGQTITADHVRAAVTSLQRHFAHVVLDLPHSFNEVVLAGLDMADRVVVLATPEQSSLAAIRETRRIFADVLGLPPERLHYVLNHPQPYSAARINDFSTATAAPWDEIPHGGEAPAATALKGETLVEARRKDAITRSILGLAELIDKRARELAALSGRSR